MWGLLGPNGAGKTTTFYMIVGIEKPTSGKVFISDINITRLPINKRAELGISYLAQEASIFRKLTVEDNLRAILQTTKLSKDQQEREDKRFIGGIQYHSSYQNATRYAAFRR